jgi:hypothetical protein
MPLYPLLAVYVLMCFVVFGKVVYETADPAKFPADVQQSVQVYPEIPPQITAQAALAERIYTLEQQPISSLTLGKTCSDEQYTELCTKIAALKLI